MLRGTLKEEKERQNLMLFNIIIVVVSLVVGFSIAMFCMVFTMPTIGDLVVFNNSDNDKGIIRFEFEKAPEDLIQDLEDGSYTHARIRIRKERK